MQACRWVNNRLGLPTESHHQLIRDQNPVACYGKSLINTVAGHLHIGRNTMSFNNLPSFKELPNFHEFPGCAWDIWGKGDQLGTVNMLTDEVVKRAASEEIRWVLHMRISLSSHLVSRSGKRVCLNWWVRCVSLVLFTSHRHIQANQLPFQGLHCTDPIRYHLTDTVARVRS